MRGLRIVDAETIDEDKRLREGRAANRDIGLRTSGSALLDVCGGIGAEPVFDRLESKWVLLRIHEHDGAVGFAERDGSGTAEDDNGSFRRSNCFGRLLRHDRTKTCKAAQ